MEIKYLDEDLTAPGTIKFLDDNTVVTPDQTGWEVQGNEFEGLDEEQIARVEQAKKFESTKVGKALDIAGAVFGAPSKLIGVAHRPNKVSDLMLEQFKKSNEMKSLSGAQKVGAFASDIGKEAIQTGAAGAGLVIPGLKAGKFARGGLMGAARGVEELAKGKSLKQAGTSAALTAGISIAAESVLKVASRVIGSLSKTLAKIGTKTKKYAVDQAIKDPSILLTKQPSTFEVAGLVKENIDDYAILAKDSYAEGLSRIKIKPGTIIKTNMVHAQIAKMGMNTKTVAQKLRAAANTQLMDISDDAIKRFVDGTGVTFDESRVINSLLHDITTGGATEAIGSGGLGRLSAVKKVLTNQMETQVPGVMKLNKKYALRLNRYKLANARFKDPLKSSSERTVQTIAQQKSGVSRARTGELRNLEAIEKALPPDRKFMDKIVNSSVAEEFENAAGNGFGEWFRLGLGSYVGNIMGGAAGGVAGVGLALGAQHPNVVKAGIVLGSGIGKAARGPVGKTLLKGAGYLGARGAGSLSSYENEDYKRSKSLLRR